MFQAQTSEMKQLLTIFQQRASRESLKHRKYSSGSDSGAHSLGERQSYHGSHENLLQGYVFSMASSTSLTDPAEYDAALDSFKAKHSERKARRSASLEELHKLGKGVASKPKRNIKKASYFTNSTESLPGSKPWTTKHYPASVAGDKPDVHHSYSVPKNVRSVSMERLTKLSKQYPPKYGKLNPENRLKSQSLESLSSVGKEWKSLPRKSVQSNSEENIRQYTEPAYAEFALPQKKFWHKSLEPWRHDSLELDESKFRKDVDKELHERKSKYGTVSGPIKTTRPVYIKQKYLIVENHDDWTQSKNVSNLPCNQQGLHDKLTNDSSFETPPITDNNSLMSDLSHRNYNMPNDTKNSEEFTNSTDLGRRGCIERTADEPPLVPFDTYPGLSQSTESYPQMQQDMCNQIQRDLSRNDYGEDHVSDLESSLGVSNGSTANIGTGKVATQDVYLCHDDGPRHSSGAFNVHSEIQDTAENDSVSTHKAESRSELEVTGFTVSLKNNEDVAAYKGNSYKTGSISPLTEIQQNDMLSEDIQHADMNSSVHFTVFDRSHDASNEKNENSHIKNNDAKFLLTDSHNVTFEDKGTEFPVMFHSVIMAPAEELSTHTNGKTKCTSKPQENTDSCSRAEDKIEGVCKSNEDFSDSIGLERRFSIESTDEPPPVPLDTYPELCLATERCPRKQQDICKMYSDASWNEYSEHYDNLKTSFGVRNEPTGNNGIGNEDGVSVHGGIEHSSEPFCVHTKIQDMGENDSFAAHTVNTDLGSEPSETDITVCLNNGKVVGADIKTRSSSPLCESQQHSTFPEDIQHEDMNLTGNITECTSKSQEDTGNINSTLSYPVAENVHSFIQGSNQFNKGKDSHATTFSHSPKLDYQDIKHSSGYGSGNESPTQPDTTEMTTYTQYQQPYVQKTTSPIFKSMPDTQNGNLTCTPDTHTTDQESNSQLFEIIQIGQSRDVKGLTCYRNQLDQSDEEIKRDTVEVDLTNVNRKGGMLDQDDTGALNNGRFTNYGGNVDSAGTTEGSEENNQTYEPIKTIYSIERQSTSITANTAELMHNPIRLNLSKEHITQRHSGLLHKAESQWEADTTCQDTMSFLEDSGFESILQEEKHFRPEQPEQSNTVIQGVTDNSDNMVVSEDCETSDSNKRHNLTPSLKNKVMSKERNTQKIHVYSEESMNDRPNKNMGLDRADISAPADRQISNPKFRNDNTTDSMTKNTLDPALHRKGANIDTKRFRTTENITLTLEDLHPMEMTLLTNTPGSQPGYGSIAHDGTDNNVSLGNQKWLAGESLMTQTLHRSECPYTHAKEAYVNEAFEDDSGQSAAQQYTEFVNQETESKETEREYLTHVMESPATNIESLSMEEFGQPNSSSEPTGKKAHQSSVWSQLCGCCWGSVKYM